MIRLTPGIPVEAREWRNQSDIHRWCRQNHLISEAQHKRWLEKIEDDQTIKMFGIEAMNKDVHDSSVNYSYGNMEPVGVCGLTSISNVHGTAEFSLYIIKKYHGLGYGREALIQLCTYGFLNLRLNRIWGEVMDENPSLETFKAVGFKEEGLLRQTYFKDGHYIDSTIISMLRGEYDVLYPDRFAL